MSNDKLTKARNQAVTTVQQARANMSENRITPIQSNPQFAIPSLNNTYYGGNGNIDYGNVGYRTRNSDYTSSPNVWSRVNDGVTAFQIGAANASQNVAMAVLAAGSPSSPEEYDKKYTKI